MTYVATPQQQYVPVTALSKDDCVPTTCAMGAARASVGVVVVNHAAIRHVSANQTGGMTYQDAVACTARVTGVQGEARFGLAPANLRDLLLAGHACTVSIDTHATANTPYRTNNFLGGHSVFANQYYSSSDMAKVKDPGTGAGYLNWPFALLIKAALLRGGGRINVIVWPDTEGVTWTAKQVRSVHPKPTYAASAGKPFAVTKPGTAYLGGITTNGESYALHSGGTANGWVQVKAAGRFGWVTGDCFR